MLAVKDRIDSFGGNLAFFVVLTIGGILFTRKNSDGKRGDLVIEICLFVLALLCAVSAVAAL